MKKATRTALLISIPAAVIAAVFWMFNLSTGTGSWTGKESAEANPFYPGEWMDYQRTWPHDYIKPEHYRSAMRQATEMKHAAARSAYDFSWEPLGPENIGGRITDLVVVPDDLNTMYIGAASGGILKTTDGGETWANVFAFADVISIGDLALDPNNPEVIYAGTGEANASSYSFLGNGIYKSTDGGQNWIHTGLTESAYIGRIVVDYSNSENVFVAACGNLFSPGGERGIYRSQDGGVMWERVLYVDEVTSGIDLVQHPEDPQILYAAMWERQRSLTDRQSFGDGSGIWKSTDGGYSWEEMTNGVPTGNDVGRIGLDISRSDPDVLYAYYDMPGSEVRIYRTDDGGSSWERKKDEVLDGNNSNFGWYFGQVRVDPNDKDILYVLGVGMFRSVAGGESWTQISGYFNSNVIHVDNHAMWIDPASGRIFQGNDGGLYYSDDYGDDWTKINNLPITQFYDIEIDRTLPYRIYGGTQDNNTIRTLSGDADDWHAILGGDGFYSLVDYENNDNIYAEYQWGGLNKSTDGGQSFDYIAGQMSGDRVNWSAPIVMHPTDPQTLYFGTYRVWKSTIGGWGWTAVSGDLTDGDDGSTYHTVTTLAISPIDPEIVVAGTDDGNVHISIDGGDSWDDISAGLPERWITRVAADPNDVNTIYVTVSGFRWDEDEPHVLMSTNLGETWVNISSDLPPLPVNAIAADPENPGYLFIGTDAGVFFTENYGDSWLNIMNGLPNVAVTSMKLHNETRKLVIGTYGLSAYSLNLDEIVAVAENDARSTKAAMLYPNPVTDFLHIAAGSPLVNVEIIDLEGRRVLEMKIAGSERKAELNVEGLAPGIYIARISSGKEIIAERFVKK